MYAHGIGGNFMKTISSTAARNNFSEILNFVVKDNTPVEITRKGAEEAVLISKSDYTAMVETMYLQSIPGLVESILACDINNPDEWVSGGLVMDRLRDG